MNHTELNSNLGDVQSLPIENCRTCITISNEYGEQVLHINLNTTDFITYNHIQQFLVERGSEFFEHLYEEKKVTSAHFELGTVLTLTLQNPNQD